MYALSQSILVNQAGNMAKNLAEVSKDELRKFLDSIDNVLCDCDGVIFIMGKVLKNVPETIASLQSSGKKVNFITNNTSVPRKTHSDRLIAQGIKTKPDDIINPSRAAIDYLKKINFQKKLYMISLPGMRKEFEDAGIKIANEYKQELIEVSFEALIKNIKDVDPEVGAVLTCFDFNMTYANLNKAAAYVSNPDVVFLTTGNDQKIIVAPGTFCLGPSYFQKIIKDVSGREPIALGKPSKDFQKYISDNMKYDPKRTLFVGDSLEQDIGFATELGYKTLLVLTGNSTLEEMKTADNDKIPNYYIESFGDLYQLMENM